MMIRNGLQYKEAKNKSRLIIAPPEFIKIIVMSSHRYYCGHYPGAGTWFFYDSCGIEYNRPGITRLAKKEASVCTCTTALLQRQGIARDKVGRWPIS